HSPPIRLRRAYVWESLLVRGARARSAHVEKAARDPDRHRISRIPFAADIDRSGKCRAGPDGNTNIITRAKDPCHRGACEGWAGNTLAPPSGRLVGWRASACRNRP